MKEPAQQEKIVTPSFNWRWLLLTLLVIIAFLGYSLLEYFTDDWVPLWIQISVLILFLVFSVCNCIFYTYQVSTNVNAHEVSWRTAKVVFKPHFLWVSVVLMTLSWVVALVIYNSWWFFIAFGTTLLVFVIGFFSLRSLVQQIESTETDIL
ncbi:MAG: hypothetical protein F4X56_03940 [Gammaproteobacteria bacterium]|nr:hypothetical protein [Gammaproteobacteria bacterium]